MDLSYQPPPLSTRAFWVRVALIVALGLLSLLTIVSLPAISQNPAYHHFADQRALLGIPHCLNVVSNLPFLVIGGWGIWFLLGGHALHHGGPFRTTEERWPYVVLFVGIGLTGLGSSCYHLDPGNESLLWDRLPMAIAFMALFAAIIGERIHLASGLGLLVPLVGAGVASVLYWHVTEMQGRGDLRFYALVQFFPLLAIPLILVLFPASYTRTADLFIALGWYALAKVFEELDKSIFSWTEETVSGHTLKHLASAMGAYLVLRMLRRRIPLVAGP